MYCTFDITATFSICDPNPDKRGRQLKYFDFAAEGEIDEAAIRSHVYPIFEVSSKACTWAAFMMVSNLIIPGICRVYASRQ